MERGHGQIQKATQRSLYTKKLQYHTNNDITLWMTKARIMTSVWPFDADPAGTGTYKEHVHIYNTVIWLNR